MGGLWDAQETTLDQTEVLTRGAAADDAGPRASDDVGISLEGTYSLADRKPERLNAELPHHAVGSARRRVSEAKGAGKFCRDRSRASVRCGETTGHGRGQAPAGVLRRPGRHSAGHFFVPCAPHPLVLTKLGAVHSVSRPEEPAAHFSPLQPLPQFYQRALNMTADVPAPAVLGKVMPSARVGMRNHGTRPG